MVASILSDWIQIIRFNLRFYYFLPSFASLKCSISHKLNVQTSPFRSFLQLNRSNLTSSIHIHFIVCTFSKKHFGFLPNCEELNFCRWFVFDLFISLLFIFNDFETNFLNYLQQKNWTLFFDTVLRKKTKYWLKI